MKKGGLGGANTKTGLYFEGKVDFLTFIKSQKNYSVKDNTIFYNNKKVAISFKKYGLYRYLEDNGVDLKRLFPRGFCQTMRYSSSLIILYSFLR